MRLTAIVTFNYEVPEEDWAIQYDDDDIGVQAEQEFLSSILIAAYGGQVEIKSLELGLKSAESDDPDEWFDTAGVSTQQPHYNEETYEWSDETGVEPEIINEDEESGCEQEIK